MRTFEYLEPATVAEALEISTKFGERGRLLAGGTDLVVGLKQGRVRPKAVISLRRLTELRYLRQTEDAVEIGAMTRLYELVKASLLLDGFRALAQAAGSIASYQIRNRGTVGGNLCLEPRCWYFTQSDFWRASYPDCRKTGGDTCYVYRRGEGCQALVSGDLVPSLVALDAQVIIYGSQGSQARPLAEFYTGDGRRHTVLERDQMVVAVRVPVRSRVYSSFVKLSRRPVDFALASAAVSLQVGEDGLITDSRIVLGSVANRPLRGEVGEEMLVGRRPGDIQPEEVARAVASSLPLVSSAYAPVWYKRRLANVAVARALREAAEKAEKGER